VEAVGQAVPAVGMVMDGGEGHADGFPIRWRGP
jgi:hypothetical protein